jgi:ankyrin repeat protein
MKYNLLARTKDNHTPLHLASLHGHVEVVKFLTEVMKCDPNCKGQYERVPLHYASENGHLDVVKYLVDTHHCDPLCPDESSATPLHRAAAKGQLEVVRYFALSMKYNLLARTKDNHTPLHLASLHGHVEVVKFLTEVMKCDPNCKGQYERVPLHYASENGHLDVVKYLVDTHWCDPLCPDGDGVTPLHTAAAVGQLEVVRYFVKCNVLVRTKNNNTPLHFAAGCGHVEVVKFLTEDVKCDPHCKGQYEQTPLHCAIERGHLNVVKYLVDTHSCDPLCRDENKITPLFLAVKGSHLEVVQYLAESCRLDPYLQPDRKTLLKACKNSTLLDFMINYVDLLHNAAISGDVESVKHFIVEKKWCPKILDRHGNNVLHNAALHGQLQVVKYLTGFLEPLEPAIFCNILVKNKHGLTAQALASQHGHPHVVSFLLRSSSNKPILGQDAISPIISIFVLGNSRSGKSTLIKALSTENTFLEFFKPRGVPPHTAGVVQTTIYNEVLGMAKIYDFAGHEEYHASHQLILQQRNHPLVVLTVDVSLPSQDTEQALKYWLSVLSNICLTSSKHIHVLVIGSHFDKIKLTEDKISVLEKITSILDNVSTLSYHGFILCDCRHSASANFKLFCGKLYSISCSIRHDLARHESDDSNRLSASLMHHLQQCTPKHISIMVKELHEQIRHLKTPGPTLIQLANLDLLIQICENLASNGHLLFLLHESDIMRSLLIPKESVVLSGFHSLLTPIKNLLDNDIGMLEEVKLKNLLSESLKYIVEPALAIKYLIFTQFCTIIKPGHLLPVDMHESVTHYFFPNLVCALRPLDLLCENHGYTHLYTWCLKSASDHQFFTPRFLHILFIQLVECGENTISKECRIWKNGILLVHSDSTRAIIEVTHQTTRVYLAMQCMKMKGCRSYLPKQRAMLTSLIKSLAHKACPAVVAEEFLLKPLKSYPPVDALEVPIAKVAHSVVKSLPTVAVKTDIATTPPHATIRALLYFDPFHQIEEKALQDIIIHSQSNDEVPSFVIRKLNIALKGCNELLIFLENGTDGSGITYCQLYHELSQYSLFTDENLYVSKRSIAWEFIFNSIFTGTGRCQHHSL